MIEELKCIESPHGNFIENTSETNVKLMDEDGETIVLLMPGWTYFTFYKLEFMKAEATSETFVEDCST